MVYNRKKKKKPYKRPLTEVWFIHIIQDNTTISMNKPDPYSTDQYWIQWLIECVNSKRFKWVFDFQHSSILKKLNQKTSTVIILVNVGSLYKEVC